jgi:hypothetical protein
MRRLEKIKKYITDSDYRFLVAAARGKHRDIPDEEYCKRLFRVRVGYELDFMHPKTFNEKLNWLKLNDHKEIYTSMVDKYEAKNIAAKKIGSEHIIPAYGVWDRFEDIDFSQFPEQFVMKCTHDSGGLVICRDKKSFDKRNAREKIELSLARNYFWSNREWPYKNVKPRILVEKYMHDGCNSVLPVYKFFNFNNGGTILQVIHGDKTSEERIDYFDEQWHWLDLHQNFKTSEEMPAKPKKFSEMLHYAKILSDGFPFLRTDFYEVNDTVYFSEFTFYSDAGFERFHPDTWDMELGNRIILPDANTI